MEPSIRVRMGLDPLPEEREIYEALDRFERKVLEGVELEQQETTGDN